MARITDANLAFVGQEPKFSVELSSIDMIKTLSWYSQNKDTKDAVKWATEYFKKKQKLDVSSVIKTYPSTFGFICRIVLNGGQLCMKDQLWFDGMVSQIKDKLNEPVIVVEVPPNVVDVEPIVIVLFEPNKEPSICAEPETTLIPLKNEPL